MRSARFAAGAAFVALLLSGTTASGQVSVPPLPGSTTTTTGPPAPLPTAPGRTTTTTTAPPPSSSTTTTTTASGSNPTPPPAPAPPPSSAGPQAGPPAAPVPPGAPGAAEGDGDEVDAADFPADLKALMDSVARTPAVSTKPLLAALRPLTDVFGIPPEEAAALGFGRFPVQGEASYVHDWWFPRFGPGWRLHQGTDVFAAAGTPVRAPGAGSLTLTMNGLGGLSAYVTEADGTYHYLAHLAGYAPDVQSGQQVRVGQVVGFVGNSGNARTTPPHLHYELHPQGGAAVDPKPHLDRWLDEALADVPTLLSRLEKRLPRVVLTTALTRGMGPRQPGPSRRDAVVWTGAYGVAVAEAERAAASVDWAPLQRAAEERAADWSAREKLAATLVDPVTPEPLRRALSPGSSGTAGEARSPRP